MEINLKKGFDLRLAGAVPPGSKPRAVAARVVAIVPDDFPGLSPKLEVKEGDQVMRGQALLRDKAFEYLKVASPAAGTVKSVVRGARRKIERVVVEVAADKPQAFDTKATDRASALSLLCASGMLARMRQRPYDIVPRPDRVPRDIFVTAIDSAPLAPSLASLVQGKSKELAAAAKLLSLVTDGKVYVTVGADWTLGDIAGAQMVKAQGKHPVGNVGVQIANIAPVNKGETVWGLDVVTMAKIGSLVLTGQVDTTANVAITGSEAKDPCMVLTTEGVALAELLKGELPGDDKHVRIISGNVLTGVAEKEDSFLRFPYRQVTIIPEGDDADEFMGWASLSPNKMSASHSFLSFGKKLFKPDARILGGRRAMIMSGQYDKMIPMDIMAEYLIKAILAKDIDQMEKLGIYEVAPEDFALAEWADTSKIPLQQIVRDGLDYLRKELE
ncbi:MAG: Na(+)-translocating NADH-quinone reductase subunit A [Bacteroidales bacterium]|nr:Na(+)-translocating NADH-quinone reductase subunit A [Bacteroidales bacterium]